VCAVRPHRPSSSAIYYLLTMNSQNNYISQWAHGPSFCVCSWANSTLQRHQCRRGVSGRHLQTKSALITWASEQRDENANKLNAPRPAHFSLSLFLCISLCVCVCAQVRVFAAQSALLVPLRSRARCGGGIIFLDLSEHLQAERRAPPRASPPDGNVRYKGPHGRLRSFKSPRTRLQITRFETQ
jgi:hypothetical protein